MDWADIRCWIDAGAGQRRWEGALDAIAKNLGARAAALGLAPRPGVVGEIFASRSASAEFAGRCRELLDGYGSEEVQARASGRGVVMWAHAATNPLLRVQDVALFVLWEEPGDGRLVAEAAQTAARAVAVHRRVCAMRAALDLYGAAFDRLPFGVAIVDRALYVSESNCACLQIFSREDGLSIYQNRLMCLFEQDRASLARAVLEASSAKAAVSASVRVSRTQGAHPYIVHAIGGAREEASSPCCLITIIDPDAAPEDARFATSGLFDIKDPTLAAAEQMLLGRRRGIV